jgi:uncharacterized protein YecE (DUF72 family)
VTVYIGTSGWQYRHWRDRFYPRKLPQKDWLRHFAGRFQAVEVNNTFYNLPEPEVCRRWREQTPADFVFALKMSRYLTHIKRLREPEEPVERFLKAAAELGGKLGPVLLQLPPRMKVDGERLGEALEAFPKKMRVAVEFRDDSWYTEPIRELLREHNVALCLADRGEDLVTPEWRTADWAYVRLHWGKARPESSYSEKALKSWSGRIARLGSGPADVFVFFNNDLYGAALLDACRLARLLQHRHVEVSRVAAASEVHIPAA